MLLADFGQATPEQVGTWVIVAVGFASVIASGAAAVKYCFFSTKANYVETEYFMQHKRDIDERIKETNVRFKEMHDELGSKIESLIAEQRQDARVTNTAISAVNTQVTRLVALKEAEGREARS